MKPSAFAVCGHVTTLDLSAFIPIMLHRGWEDEQRLADQVGRLRWCAETCFSHQYWATFNFDTMKPDVLQRRIVQTQAKLERIAARYKPRATE
jgi:hypothetical protein